MSPKAVEPSRASALIQRRNGEPGFQEPARKENSEGNDRMSLLSVATLLGAVVHGGAGREWVASAARLCRAGGRRGGCRKDEKERKRRGSDPRVALRHDQAREGQHTGMTKSR